jgi:polar amino acid transport system substrate-binding protein
MSVARYGASGALACTLFAWTAPTPAQIMLHTAPQETSTPKFIPPPRGGTLAIGGFCIDIMHAIEHADPGIHFVLDPEWQSLARMEAGLETGKLDASCAMLRNDAREGKMRFLEPPLLVAKFYLAVRADDDVTVRSWDDVRRLGNDGVVLTIAGHGTLKKLQAFGGLKIDSGAKDPATNLQKLLAGRGRFFYHRSPGIREEILSAGLEGRIKLLPAPMDTQPLYMTVSKKLQPEKAERLQKAIMQISGSGELKKLLKKWE